MELPNRPNNLLIFDFDGTIADSLNMVLRIVNRLSSEFSFDPVKPDEIRLLKDMPYQKIIRYLRIPTIKVPALAARVRKELKNDLDSMEPVAGIRVILRNLRDTGHSLGVLSSNSGENIDRFLDKNGLDMFDFIQTSSKLWGKTRGLRDLISNREFDKQNIIYIGDETRDILSARKAEIRVAAVTWGYNSKAVLTRFNPDYIIDCPEDLLKLHSLSLFGKDQANT